MEDNYIHIHQDLINACRTGDRDAQFRIYKLYYKAMYNTSLRIVNDTAEAEDIMQEAFLEAFRHLSSYSGEGSFGSWLKRIVINRSLDCLRKKRDTVSLDEVDADIPDTSEQGRDEDLQLQVAEVKRAIAMLPDDYRVVLNLFLLEGYDHEEIAQVLNISNQLSRTRYSRARQKLLGLLRKHKLTNVFSTN
ncbi:MAG TPA: sigma-70 family RNA polymerase sigma factor [Bacteroidales bacterium]|nr:sigma-70 family RNA polymerase sigma factor [Bacteroidales bacterium]HPS62360.1 sigma-70 family RNA polymerase sigma factor [Bacteroidales bacterium]